MGASYEMSEDDRREIVAEFLSESDQHIQTLNSLLLKAEELVKAGQIVAVDQINTMFRAAHTVKGSASMLGFDNLSHLTHEMETLLDRVRNNKMPLTMPVIEVLFKAFDSLNALLEKLRNEGNDQADVSGVIAEIKAILAGDVAPASTPVVATPVAAPATSETTTPASSTGYDPETSKYLPAFLEDADQCVQKFNDLLMNFEKNNCSADNINEAFRLAHTLKGSSGIIKCRAIESVAHKMEDLLSELRAKNIPPTQVQNQMLFKGIDWIKGVLDQLRKGTYQEKDISEFLKNFTGGSSPAPMSASAISAASVSIANDHFSPDKITDEIREKAKAAFANNNLVFKIQLTFSAKCIKQLKVVLVAERLKKVGQLIACTPKVESIPDVPGQPLIVHMLYASPNQEADVKKTLTIDEVEITSIVLAGANNFQPVVVAPAPVAVAAPVAQPVANAAAPQAAKAAPVEITTMRVDSRKLDNLMNFAGELVITRARFAQLVNEFNNEVFLMKEQGNRLSQWSSQLEIVKGAIKKAVVNGQNLELEKTLKILESMESSAQEVQTGTLHKTISSKVYSLDEATSMLGKLSSDIQSAVMQTRMMPIEGVFSRFKRLVRDIAKEVGKEVNLEVYGEDTELDKKIIDTLPDSLTHMIRNSIDHGLESAKDRLAVGKKEAGTVRLKASHQGNSICIEIGDDGRGLDPAKISKKALEKGLVTEEKLAKLEDKEKLNFVFLPGFSTAEKVTGLSGRGVGMDVVKKMIESLNGTVDINSELGKGSTFVLKIPLTLAIIQALLVMIEGQVYAIPLEQVSEIIKMSQKDIYAVDGNPMIKLRGHAMSLMDMTPILGVKDARNNSGERKVVVVTAGGEYGGITVDRLIGEDEIVIKAFPEYFANVKGISGASILGDGNIALILDVTAMMKEG